MKFTTITLAAILLPLVAQAVMPPAELVEDPEEMAEIIKAAHHDKSPRGVRGLGLSGNGRGNGNGRVPDSDLSAVNLPENESANGNGPIKGADGRATYIVTFNEESGDPTDKAKGLAKKFDGEVRSVYKKVLNGAAVRIPPGQAKALQESAGVASVEADQIATAMAPSERNTWGQDRVDQCDAVGQGSDSTFERMDASNVKVYIFDTGIDANHEDFSTSNLVSPNVSQGGCSKDYCDSGGCDVQPADRNGHGTHVASTVCGEKYGVVTCGQEQVCAIQVLNSNGSGSYSSIIDAINGSVQDCQARIADPSDTTTACVGNMSLGGGSMSALDQAVNNAAAAGLTIVVAAGNSNRDACGYSPARAVDAITVGATDIDDEIASFSNTGSCVDVYGPGKDVTAASAGTTSETRLYSGTSMASPHVAALAAAILQANPTYTGSQVDGALTNFLTMKDIDCAITGSGIATLAVTGDCSLVTNDCSSPPAPTCAPCQSSISNCDQACCDSFGPDQYSWLSWFGRCFCSSC